ncbi:glycosyltransferase [Rubellimicrobium aerolatum]|uniref:Glycosyltransferase n=1 Tax=Rubellimicrobium aerolatum TaxID=490979 RepID=A0ABW0SEH5_9RHOB|nr:glycosyltransferase [Rubellimicrobium aerolatum]MBP1806803.1 glycosyltransferase involved in cell wall biosynthesis [Rubellimicrobium aerolatum]
MPSPLVSVVVNNFNYAAFVGTAIDSALAQQGDGFGVEVVVVDDGSTDGSGAVLDRYEGRATVVRQRNAGQAGAINAGVRASRGEILCFLDADDWWAPSKVAAVVAAFRADPGAALAYHRLQPVGPDGRPALRPIPRTLCRGDLRRRMERSAGWWPFPMTSAVAVRRSAWEEAGPIPEAFRISADAWLVGIHPFLGRVAALPDSLGFYRLHANNWYRAADDAPMLRRRMAHWEATVAATNGFLAGRGLPSRLSLGDHFPHKVARARLEGAGIGRRLRLGLDGLRFGGEPSLPRRVRDTARIVAELGAGEPPPARAAREGRP